MAVRHRRRLRPIITNVVINNIATTGTAASSANARYVRSVSVRCLNMFSVYVFSDLLLLFCMLISTSTVLEFHMLVAAVVMFNMLELIMEKMPNYPTKKTSCGFTNSG